MDFKRKGIAFIIVSFVIGCLSGCGTQNSSESTIIKKPMSAAVSSETKPQDPRIGAAQDFFNSCVDLGRSFDLAVLDCYSDTARIVYRRKSPTGQDREIVLSGAAYKAMASKIMPVAKARGDRSEYSDAHYQIEGDRVRITATRYSELKRYSSPLSALVGPSADGRWLIEEEITESQPF